MSIELKLFFGLSVDDLFKKALDMADEDLKKQYLSINQDYLCTIEHEGTSFIGKWIKTKSCYLEELENLENHILSMLKQIAPVYTYESNPLVLIPIQKRSNE